MLIDTQYNSSSKKLITSYVDKTGKLKMKYFDWAHPSKYEKCNDNDTERDLVFKSWDGHSVKKVPVNFPDRYAVYEFLDALPQSEQDEIFEYNLPDIYFVDIETDRGDDGFAPPSDEVDNDGNVTRKAATEAILSISVVYENKIILMGIKELSLEAQKRIHNKTNEYFKKDNVVYEFRYVRYDDEFDMIYNFFNKMVPEMPVITGWNFVNYDWAYLVNRSRLLTKTINGREQRIDPTVSSPTGRLEKIWNPIPGSPSIELPVHRMIFDYMQLYEISVSGKLVGVDKIKYDGQLDQLYHDDFEKFMYYNAVDSVLVQKIHDARNYISIIYGISTLAKIKISTVINQSSSSLASLAITEGVLRNRFREQDNVVLFKDSNDKPEAQGIAGGWVKDPVVGMNRWCVTYDFASICPKSILYRT
jgi:DNA polymerase elongation subunit (family B)